MFSFLRSISFFPRAAAIFSSDSKIAVRLIFPRRWPMTGSETLSEIYIYIYILMILLRPQAIFLLFLAEKTEDDAKSWKHTGR